MNRRGVLIAAAPSAVVAAVGAGSAAADGPGQSAEQAVGQALGSPHPRNVIFLLGDGMGTQEITAASTTFSP